MAFISIVLYYNLQKHEEYGRQAVVYVTLM